MFSSSLILGLYLLFIKSIEEHTLHMSVVHILLMETKEKWLHSYLDDTHQYVQMNNTDSGSLLGFHKVQHWALLTLHIVHRWYVLKFTLFSADTNLRCSGKRSGTAAE